MINFCPGDRIDDRYLIYNVMRGGMGLVLLCHDELLEMSIALKTYQLKSDEDWRPILGSFIREAKTWISIGDEKNVVQAYYVFNAEIEEEYIPFLAIELIEGNRLHGNSLWGWINNSVLNLNLTLHIAHEICCGMDRIQKKLKISKFDFVHRDLKPQNILVSHEGSIKITDFGLAKVFQENISRIHSLPHSALSSEGHYTFGLTKSICGTPPYMSPEQCMGISRLDQRSDIYSFGCILFEMCTGCYIFQADSSVEFIEKHISEQPISVRSLNPSLPNSLVALIDRCLAKKPDDRPQNFKEIRDYLQKIIRAEVDPSGGLGFSIFGFSTFTDKPLVKKDWDMDKEGEVILLGRGVGVDYVINQGFVKNRAEFDKIVEKYKATKDDRKKKLEQYNFEKQVNEFIGAGDSLFRLSEAAEANENVKLLKSAISNYKSAQQLIPLDPRINFRLGMANQLLAAYVQDSNKSLSENLITLAIEEFNSVLRQKMEPTLDVIGTIYYLLPYHALFNRTLPLILRGDLKTAAKGLKALLSWLKKSDLSKCPNVCEQLKKATTESLQKILKGPNDFS